jgi:putative addiction module component (TIGR02574 family)
MSTAANELFDAAMALSPSERVELATRILETVDDDAPVELSPEWKAEIKRRLDEIDRGEGTWLSEEEVEQRLRTRYGTLEN